MPDSRTVTVSLALNTADTHNGCLRVGGGVDGGRHRPAGRPTPPLTSLLLLIMVDDVVGGRWCLARIGSPASGSTGRQEVGGQALEGLLLLLLLLPGGGLRAGWRWW